MGHEEELARELGGRGRAKLAWDCYAIGVDPAIFFDPEKSAHDKDDADRIRKLFPGSRRNLSLGKHALEKLASLYDGYGGQLEGGVASLSHVSQSSDLTTKLLLRLSDGLEIETVIIPWKGVRSTFLRSNSLGSMKTLVGNTFQSQTIAFYYYRLSTGCTFCATGRMGLNRSLSSEEILAQMFFAKKICRENGLPEPSNVVFMGMGESSDNVDAVVEAIKILTTSNDELRKKQVPTTKYSMSELRQGLIDALLDRPVVLRTIMLEVALTAGVNDSAKEANEVSEFARVIVDSVPGCKLIVNLIPFNDIGRAFYEKPTEGAVVAFQRRLWAQGINAHVRTTRGDDESVACGQLATKKKQASELSV